MHAGTLPDAHMRRDHEVIRSDRQFDPRGHAGYHRARVVPMSHNTFGHLFRVTTFGESHGVALGCVVDGCPPRIPLTAADIQPFLDKRRPGQSRFTTQRREPDEVKILSGTFPDETGREVTTGTPIALRDRERRPALEGLFRDQGHLSAEPRRLRL